MWLASIDDIHCMLGYISPSYFFMCSGRRSCSQNCFMVSGGQKKRKKFEVASTKFQEQ